MVVVFSMFVVRDIDDAYGVVTRQQGSSARK
jgi:hypothetical protein